MTPAAAPPPPEPSAAPPAKASVLIADDDPSVLQVLGLAFRAAGHKVTTAADGALGLSAVERLRFDLLVLDILMPGATGWEVLARAQERTPPGVALPRAILITGFNGEYVLDIHLLAREGVGAMLLKPFPATVILEEAQRVLAMPPLYTLPRAPEPKPA